MRLFIREAEFIREQAYQTYKLWCVCRYPEYSIEYMSRLRKRWNFLYEFASFLDWQGDYSFYERYSLEMYIEETV